MVVMSIKRDEGKKVLKFLTIYTVSSPPVVVFEYFPPIIHNQLKHLKSSLFGNASSSSSLLYHP